ncbi:hypothetical protein KC343_g395 [Hortaea werneckii]|nr:hypothetical protein KC352_g3189 [Hortaea werneckii]KAI7571249.1 hypothetical protein KC317_g1781 [Hortaea werneckii]KAI7628013.1 hypothetical protein KC346_g433 [Hortaea werneckii]KAI7637983.1 hypothetical protein KC343_g395 [Hortaea werneckii]KAI7683615.1 hypothetical protein KC319_g384 [Hortaea werneckii]
MPPSKMEFPKAPIDSSPTTHTEITQAVSRHDIMSYLVLDPPTSDELRRWFGFRLNFKYFNCLREIETSRPRPIQKDTWDKALNWLQTVRPDLTKDAGKGCNECVKVNVEAAVGKFMGRVGYENHETKLGFVGVVGSIVFHWCRELRDFENGTTNTDTRDSWKQAFKDWNDEHSREDRTLPSEFQVLDLKADEIPLGLRSERPLLGRENEFEVYNRLFWLYWCFRKNVMPKSKWVDYWVASQRGGDRVTLQTLPWYGELGESEEETDGPDQQASNGNEGKYLSESLQENADEAGDYVDCPCKYYFVVDEEVGEHELQNDFLESKDKTAQLQLNSLARCMHPGAFRDLGHWRQTIRDQAKLNDYGFDFMSIEMEWYTEEPGPETSPVDERLILGKGWAESCEEVLSALEIDDDIAEIHFRVKLMPVDKVKDESGGSKMKDS